MIRRISFMLLLIILSSSNNKFISNVEKDIPYLKNLYLDIHKNPEISLMEKETSKKLADELKKVGFDVTENFGGYGVVGILKNGKGPTILYRTDLDALPMEEKTGLSYASQVKTKDFNGNEVSTMHSCGHDIHMAVWTGTARALAKRKNEWKPRSTNHNSGSIWKYAQTVGPAHEGAVTQPGAKKETHTYADI